MGLRKRAFQQTIAIFLILSSIFILINVANNGHIHQCENGVVIFHAHPYNKDSSGDPVKRHKHNTFEFILYALITFLFELSLFSVIIGIMIFIIILFRTIEFLDIVTTDNFIFNPPVRAPPENSLLK